MTMTTTKPPPTFQLMTRPYQAIRCLLCGMLSYDLTDIQARFCAQCHRFHDEDAGEVVD
jgi:hypothetical protein